MTRDVGDVKKTKILDRVKKLLALSTSSNVNEAATAAAAAQRLMLEHKLTEADVPDGQAGQMFAELSMGAAGFATRWKFVLVTAVARSFFCEAIGLRVGRRRKVRIVGSREDVEIASQVFKYLLREINRLAQAEAVRVAWEEYRGFVELHQYLDSFRRGAVVAVIEKLRQGEEDFVASDSRALILVKRDREQVREYVASRFSNTKTPEREFSQIDDLAFVRGYEQAQAIAIPGTAPESPLPTPESPVRSPVNRSRGEPAEVFVRPVVRPGVDVVVTQSGSIPIPSPEPQPAVESQESGQNVDSFFDRLRKWWEAKD